MIFKMRDKEDLVRSRRCMILAIVSSFRIYVRRVSVDISLFFAIDVARGLSSENVRTASVNVATSWSTLIMDMRLLSAELTPRRKLRTIERDISSPLT
jgi:hypothetical protein